MATLESLRLSGWKSIKDAEVTFRRLNILVGANGSGKSNLVSFFKLLSEMMARRLQVYLAESGGPDTLLHFGLAETRRIAADIRFESNSELVDYGFKLGITAITDALTFVDEHVRRPHGPEIESKNSGWTSQGHSEAVFPGLGGSERRSADKDVEGLMANSRPYHFHDTTGTAAVRRACYIDDNHRLRPDAGNLAAMLYVYSQARPKVYRRIISSLKCVAPFFDDFRIEPRRLNPKQVQLDWHSGVPESPGTGTGLGASDYLLGPHQLSDGTLRMIALTTLLLQPEEDLPPLIVIDEPELGLHPAAIGILAGLLKQASVHSQVLVATQSATLLNHFDAEDVIVADSRDGVSTFRRLDPEPYREWIEEYGLSDLWERNVIGGGPY